MPIYEYSCLKCYHEFEFLARSSAHEKTICPKCGSVKTSKKLSLFASNRAHGDFGDISSCTQNPSSCGRCGTGKPHSHD